MKNSSYYISGLITALALISASCSGNQQKEAKTDSEVIQGETSMVVEPVEVFKNEYVTAMFVSLEPNEKLDEHMAEKRVIYSLSDYTIDWTEKGNNEGTKSWKTGDSHSHDAGLHSAKNTGTTTAEWIAFIRNGTTLPDCSSYSSENDVVSVAPDFCKLLLDNEEFQVIKIKLPPGEEIPTHSGINRLVYSLSDYQIQYESDKTGSGDTSFEKGDVHWHEGCQHSLKNIGRSDAEFLVVVFKQ